MENYQSHPEYLALLETVLHNPADDAPRLIIADWIEEAGDDDRAKFIRQQITGDPAWRQMRIPQMLKWFGVWWPEKAFCRVIRKDGCPVKLSMRRPKDEEGDFATELIIERGFLSELCVSGQVFLEQAKKIFAQSPVERVRLTDVEARKCREDSAKVEVHKHGCLDLKWRKFYGSSVLHRLDEVFYDLLVAGTGLMTEYSDGPKGLFTREYETSEDFIEDISIGCVNYGRQFVGLPDLPAN
ncbi:TIGR02996 domain-containing protein [Zavarzinella formosa]|uniref:TIGR02996 domain-containing protein n=1 Tax=Zavarzinella formosa TaxID=360055 RepID=UPI00036105AA|nr:TIGR02996 domain-containing protein [Zavarzinella formosa]